MWRAVRKKNNKLIHCRQSFPLKSATKTETAKSLNYVTAGFNREKEYRLTAGVPALSSVEGNLVIYYTLDRSHVADER